MKYISKFGLILVVISFFMPMALTRNGFQLANELSYLGSTAFMSFFLYTSFVAALAGVLLIIKKNMKIGVEWFLVIISAISAIIAFANINSLINSIGYDISSYFGTQTGVVFMIIGYIIAIVFLVLCSLNEAEPRYRYITKKCRQCGTKYDNASVCPNCGSSLYEETNEPLKSDNLGQSIIISKNTDNLKTCAKCKKQVSIDLLKCPRCGGEEFL